MTETERIDKALELESLQLPPNPRVVRIEWEPFEDISGAEGLKLTVVLNEETTDKEIEKGGALPIERAIRDRLREMNVAQFPYIWIMRENERYAE